MVVVAKKDIVPKVGKLKEAYGPVTIVGGFDLKVTAGEVVALTGRNGAGKSTVLRCLVEADHPDEDTVEVLSVKMKEASPEIRRNVATVIGDLGFFPDLSVMEHLDLLAWAHGITNPDDLVDETLDEARLIPQIEQLPSTLSPDQRQRLVLIAVFVRPRYLLVLNEPERRLDVEGVEWLGARLGAELRDGLVIVPASHEPSLLVAIGAHEVRLGECRWATDDSGPPGKSMKDSSVSSYTTGGAAGRAVTSCRPCRTPTQ